MKVLRKVMQHFTTKKGGASEEKEATKEDKESEIKVPDQATLLVKRRRSSESDIFAKLQQERKEQLKQSPDRKAFRSRGQTMSCSSYFTEDQATMPFMKDRKLTENAKHLTPEQMHALEMDIFRPLDFYEILFDKMRAKDKAERTHEEVHDMRSLITMVLRKVMQHFTTKKGGASEEKEATAGEKEIEMKTPDQATLLVKRRRSSESDIFVKLQQEQKEQLKQSPDRKKFRSRGQTMSCSSYFTEDQATMPYMKDRKLTENAKRLTPEQMHALEMDIFKPLDFYEILFDKMKANDKAERTHEEVHDMRSLIKIVNYKAH
ncbi:hypothetical protein ACROYT_G039013 [Oculina patagonica]